jgi:hypothetical protein
MRRLNVFGGVVASPPPLTICATFMAGSLIATAAMVFMGCSGMGMSNMNAVATL